MKRMRLWSWAAAMLLLAAWTVSRQRPLAARPAGPQASAGQSADVEKPSPAASMSAKEIGEGKMLFQGECGECHGVDGSGAVGPNLHGVAQKRGDQGLFSVIRNGIPGTGMAPVMSLNDHRAWEVISYLRTLGLSADAMAVTGDPAMGHQLYNENGCSTCHSIAGQDGTVGPDLTQIGKMRAPKYLLDLLRDPGAHPPADTALPERGQFTGYMVTQVVTKTGQEVSGIRVNEDTFTIQLRDVAGHYYSFNKADLKSLKEEPGKSVMPSFANLPPGQLDDLVAYLFGLKGAQ